MIRKSEMTKDEIDNLTRKIVLRFSLLTIFLCILTFLPAGTFHYWQVYVYLLFLIVPMLFILSYFLKHDPKFLERRIRFKEKEKTQRIIQMVFSVFFLFAFIISGLDKRFGWSEIPFYVTLLADFTGLLGYLIVFIAFKQNSYASRIIEVERNQQLISSGIYSFVRHPMYAGVIIMWTSMPIALGSYWGLIPVAAIPFALIIRILNEESLLARELPEYKEYCQKTKYRLIPYIW